MVLAGWDDVGASIAEVWWEVAVVEQVLHHRLLSQPWRMVSSHMGTFLVVLVTTRGGGTGGSSDIGSWISILAVMSSYGVSAHMRLFGCSLLYRRQAFHSASYCSMLSAGRFLCLFIK